MLTLTTAISRVAARLNKNANDTTVAARIKNHINDACLEKWHAYPWSFRWREYPLVLSARVTSGTLTATNGSQTVTASGTPFDTTLHKGAWIRFTGDTLQAVYRIINVVSTSSVTIEPAYQGTTGSSKAYELCKIDYLLPTDLSDVGRITVTYSGLNLPVRHQMTMSDYYQFPAGVGSPDSVTVFRQSQTLSTYTTGTLSGTVSTTAITGVGTAWLSNVTPGDELVISGDTNTYKVLSVESDTAMTLYNNLSATATGASYTISRQYGKLLRVTPVPDNPYVLFVKGLRAYAPLVNNSDTNELLVRWPHAVIESACSREAGSSPDPREDSIYMKSEKLWQIAEDEDEALIPYTNYTPIFDPRGR